MSDLLSLLFLLAVCGGAFAAFRYRQKHVSEWTERKRQRFDIIGTLVFGALLFGKFAFDYVQSKEEMKQAQANVDTANRNLWESVKTLPLGLEITSVALNQLRKDLDDNPEQLRKALGDAEFQAFKNMLAEEDLRVVAIDELSKKLGKAKADLKQAEADLKEVRKFASKFAELKDAAAAVQEKRRIAPPGKFQITATVRHKPETELDELAIGILRTRLECFDTESVAQKGDLDVYTFKSVSKQYAEETQQRLQKLGATVTIAEEPAN